METALPVLCIPGLGCSPRLYAEQVPLLWSRGPVTIAQHTASDRMDALASAILAEAPPRFALVGLSMGGYLGFEILRQAPERVARLALLDTSARPDTPEQSASRRAQIELAGSRPMRELADALFPRLVHRSRHGDERLRALFWQMAEETGAAAYVRQQTAIMHRRDSRPLLASIRCPTLVLVGDGDELTPPAIAEEIAAAIPRARLVVVPECGHASTLERPAEVGEALMQWLAA
ncbi:MAG: alpha/beta fold hydrolase [Gammaproteobacteria bacterium]|nr:alpha/beta fold hydrolase [Gammaproteobacteria bacterium]